MKINHKRFTPDLVEQLSNCEKFVFGSNLEGMHMGGAARVAHQKFGAEWGVGDGPTGRVMLFRQCMVDLKAYARMQRNLLPMQRNIQ